MKFPIWRRLSIQLQIIVNVTPGTLAFRDWLFNVMPTLRWGEPLGHGRRRYWVALAIRLLGVDVGGGFCYVTQVKEDGND